MTDGIVRDPGTRRDAPPRRRKVEINRRAIVLSFVISAVLSGIFAGAALAGFYGAVWAEWINTQGGHSLYAAYSHLKQVGAEPRTYDWGCGNMALGSGGTEFSVWYCGSPGNSANTPELSGEGVWAQAAVWNDNPSYQELWGWRYYYSAG